ncbi:MAG: Asp23/Gls24 family envelope stress response protein, partial [Dysgonomonas sp.]
MSSGIFCIVVGGSGMAEDRKSFKIREDHLGEVKIADEVVAIIAGLAVTEVEGVSSMAGNITNEIVSKLGMKNLSKGIRVSVLDGKVDVDVALNVAYGYAIPEVSLKVQ